MREPFLTLPCANDDALIGALGVTADLIRNAVYPAGYYDEGGKVIGYRIDFDLRYCEHHARRLRVNFPALSQKKYDNPHVIDLWRLIADDDCEHIVSRSLKSACRVYGLDTPEDDCDGADIPDLLARGDWAGITRHLTYDLMRTEALAKFLGVLPARYAVLDIETAADPRMAHLYDDVKLGNVKDPEKVAKAVAEKRAAQADKAALDPWAGIPICIGIKTDDTQASEADGVTFDGFVAQAITDSVEAR